jgi:hypothetical protein
MKHIKKLLAVVATLSYERLVLLIVLAIVLAALEVVSQVLALL